MQPLIAMAALTALAAFRVARLVAGTIGLEHEFGITWAVIGAASLMLFRFALPIRIGAFLAAVSLWRWPWLAALMMKFVWRHRNAGVCSTSTTAATSASGVSSCTSVSTGTHEDTHLRQGL